jgi:AcrR family transcriptional regulator
VGRKAGVAAEETKASLLSAAAKVFARRGYDGASIAEISSEAGLTSGAIYAHYGSKAELFVSALRVYAEKDLDQLISRHGSDFLDALTSVGSTFDRREPTEESLVISAIIAARNDPEVGALLTQQVADREALFQSLIREEQAAGVLAQDVSAPAVSRLALMISLGSLVAGALGLEPVDHQDWAEVIVRVVGAFRNPPPPSGV